MTGGWRKLHNKINDYCSWLDIINVIIFKGGGMVEACGIHGEKWKCTQNCDGKT